MALPTKRSRIVVFLVSMANKADITSGNFPCVSSMAGSAGDTRVPPFPVQPAELPVARLAVNQGANFSLLEMTGVTSHGHHGPRGIYFMTLGASPRRWVALLVADITKKVGMLTFQQPRMPIFLAGRRGRPQWHKWPPLGYRMASRAAMGEDLPLLVNVLAIVASEAARPAAMAYIVGIGRPVYFHMREDAPVINGGDSNNGAINRLFILLEKIGKILPVIAFERLPDFHLGPLPIRVFLHQSFNRQLLDPGQCRRNIPVV
jgi:hypothetical protein